MQYAIPSPDPKIFRSSAYSLPAAVRENPACYLIEKITYDGGLKIWYYGCPHPKKGFPLPEMNAPVNLCKRLLMKGLYVSIRHLPLFLRPMGLIRTLAASYEDVCYPSIKPFIFKDEYLAPASKEIRVAAQSFLFHILKDEVLSDRLSDIIAIIFDYDCAYRYRFQDIIEEIDRYALIENPRRELQKAITVFLSREKHQKVRDNAERFVKIARILLLVPRFKVAFQNAVLCMNWDRSKFDDDDRYWIASRPDYDFGGNSLEERMKGIEMPQLFNVVVQ